VGGSVTDWISAIATAIAAVVGVAALVAIFGVRKQIALHSRQMKLDLENVYVARYWQVMDDLAASKGADTKRRHILRYLQLSEDQCDLRARRRITNSTWRYWRSGIVEQLADVEFAGTVLASPAHLLDHVRKLAADPTYEPERIRAAK